MQLNLAFLVRGIGHGITATLAIFEQKINVLASQKLKFLGRGKLQFHNRDIWCGTRNADDTTRQLAHCDHALGGHNARVDHHISQRLGTADQHAPCGFLFI